MGNGVKVLIDTKHFEAKIALKSTNYIRNSLENGAISEYLEKVMREKITEGLVEFHIMVGIMERDREDLLDGFRILTGRLYEERMKIIREFSAKILGGKDALQEHAPEEREPDSQKSP